MIDWFETKKIYNDNVIGALVAKCIDNIYKYDVYLIGRMCGQCSLYGLFMWKFDLNEKKY